MFHNSIRVDKSIEKNQNGSRPVPVAQGGPWSNIGSVYPRRNVEVNMRKLIATGVAVVSLVAFFSIPAARAMTIPAPPGKLQHSVFRLN
jgi:hypothetical protein